MLQPNFSGNVTRASHLVDTSNLGRETAGQQATNTQDEKPFRIVVEETEKFPDLLKGGLITSYDLMELISSLMSPVYKDFAGCFVNPVMNGFEVRMYFKTPANISSNDILAFREANNAPGESIIDKVTWLGRPKTRKYVITKEGKQGLSELLYTYGNRPADWNRCINEDAVQVNNFGGYGNASTVYAVVTGFDINKILAKIYGNKIDGDPVTYLLNPVKIIGATGQNNQSTASAPIQNWLLSLQAMSKRELDKVMSKVGMCYTNGIPMVGRK